MEAVVRGLVIPKITFVGEVEDTANGDDSHFDYGMFKRYGLLVYSGKNIQRFEDNDKGKLESIRDDIVEKINGYYSMYAFLNRPSSEGKF